MAENYIKKVAIVGASGHVGKYIVEALLKTGKHIITAVTRSDSKATFPPGVLAKKVDYASQDSLVSALEGQDALIITLSVFAPRDIQSKLIDAAAAAKVPWILPNEFGGDPFNTEMGKDNFLGEGKAKYRDYIEELGVSSWIAVVCGFWYEWSFGGGADRYGFDLKEKSLTLYGEGQTKICTSTWPQVGRAVAALLSLKLEPKEEGDASLSTHFKNKPVYFASFTASQKDMLESLLRVTGDKLENWKVTKVPVKEYYQDAVAEFHNGSRAAFPKLLYSRAFFPDSNDNFAEGLQNDLLGLTMEDLDEATKVTIQLAENGELAV